MAQQYQFEMPLIHREVSNQLIEQRATDGYINAAAMCKAVNKAFDDYARLDQTGAFMHALHAEMKIPIPALVQRITQGPEQLQGIWVHPQVAINLAQWLSPQFSVQVGKWVFEWLDGKAEGQRNRLPDHVRRYLVNRPKIPATHFSMLDQMTLRLLAPLEEQGYILPPEMMPDIALGKMFSSWLRTIGRDPNSFKTYSHEFLDHRLTVQARLYPNDLITEFNMQLDNWLRDGRAREYFESRDNAAIEPLSKVLATLETSNRIPGNNK